MKSYDREKNEDQLDKELKASIARGDSEQKQNAIIDAFTEPKPAPGGGCAMTESSAFVAGGGGFVRVRDNAAGGFAAEFNRERQLAEERERLKQQKQERIAAFRAEEEEKRRASNEAKAVQAFRDFHDRRGSVTDTVMRYTEARGYRRENYKIANAELLNPEFIKVYYPEKAVEMEKRANAKAWAADVKPDYVAKCKFCRIVFFTDGDFAEHQRTTRPCPKCQSVCSSGGQVHRCSVYGAAIEEDRVPEVKYEGEE